MVKQPNKYKNVNGHLQKYMGIDKDGKEIWKYVYRLKTGAKDGQIVHHKDGNSLNNDKSNLEVMTKAKHNVVDPRHHLGGRKKGS